jgi:hypothetical protein
MYIDNLLGTLKSDTAKGHAPLNKHITGAMATSHVGNSAASSRASLKASLTCRPS